jgi:hypothetical protein
MVSSACKKCTTNSFAQIKKLQALLQKIIKKKLLKKINIIQIRSFPFLDDREVLCLVYKSRS